MNIEKAINILAVTQDNTMKWKHEGFINNETDFNNITVEDNKSFNFTWADVQAKATELDNETAPQVSGNQKLLDLGLTQAEATALTGYTPPVAE